MCCSFSPIFSHLRLYTVVTTSIHFTDTFASALGILQITVHGFYMANLNITLYFCSKEIPPFNWHSPISGPEDLLVYIAYNKVHPICQFLHWQQWLHWATMWVWVWDGLLSSPWTWLSPLPPPAWVLAAARTVVLLVLVPSPGCRASSGLCMDKDKGFGT